LASALQFPDSVLEIAPLEIGTKTLQVGVGFATHQDAIWAAVRATAMARAGLQGASAEMVLLVTAGVPSQDTMPMIRSATPEQLVVTPNRFSMK